MLQIFDKSGGRTPHFLFEKAGEIVHIVIPDHVAHFGNIVFPRHKQFLRLFHALIYDIFQRRAVHLVFENGAETAGRNTVIAHDLI